MEQVFDPIIAAGAGAAAWVATQTVKALGIKLEGVGTVRFVFGAALLAAAVWCGISWWPLDVKEVGRLLATAFVAGAGAIGVDVTANAFRGKPV